MRFIFVDYCSRVDRTLKSIGCENNETRNATTGALIHELSNCDAVLLSCSDKNNYTNLSLNKWLQLPRARKYMSLFCFSCEMICFIILIEKSFVEGLLLNERLS